MDPNLTIERVGEYASMPVYKFLIYETQKVTSERDIFVLKIGTQRLGYITRVSGTRPVEWKPGVVLTELNFFSVVGEWVCMRFDVIARRAEDTRISITAIYCGLHERISPSRVFAWCERQRRDVRKDMLNDELRVMDCEVVYWQRRIRHAVTDDERSEVSAMHTAAVEKLARLTSGTQFAGDVPGQVTQLVTIYHAPEGETLKLAHFTPEGLRLESIDTYLVLSSDARLRCGDYVTVKAPKETVPMIIESVRDPRFFFWQRDSCMVIEHRRSNCSNTSFEIIDLFDKIELLARDVGKHPELLLKGDEFMDIHLILLGNANANGDSALNRVVSVRDSL